MHSTILLSIIPKCRVVRQVTSDGLFIELFLLFPLKKRLEVSSSSTFILMFGECYDVG